jgi:HlyD family secretion protein
MPVKRNYRFNDETHAIISNMPKGFSLWGSTAVLGILIILITLSCIIHYPQTIKVAANINAGKVKNLTFAKSDMEFDTVFFKNGVFVDASDVVAVLKNEARWQDVRKAQATIGTLILTGSFTPNYNLKLGEITPQYLDFVAAWSSVKQTANDLLFQKMRYNFLANCRLWESKYLLKAPVSGSVFWQIEVTENVSIATGTPIFYIKNAENTEGGDCQILIPDAYVNQVKIGQTTLVDWNNQSVPLRGKITQITPVPTEKGYRASISLDTSETLLQNSPPTRVPAEIVIQDALLIEYLFQPLRLFLEKQRQSKHDADSKETPKLVQYTGK